MTAQASPPQTLSTPPNTANTFGSPTLGSPSPVGPPPGFPTSPAGVTGPPIGSHPISNPFFQILAAQRSFWAVLATILLWEFLISLKLEKKLIWKQKWNLESGLYILNRYFTLALQCLIVWLSYNAVSQETCESIGTLMPVGWILSVITCSAIFLYRVWILSKKSSKILALLRVLMILETALMAVSATQFQQFALPPLIRGCIILPHSSTAGDLFGVLLWTAPFVFNGFIFVLAIMYSLKGDEALHTRLLANGVLHYFIINLVGVLNLAFLLQGTPQLKPLLTDAFIVASSILATRLVLYSRSYLPKSTPFDGKPTHPFHPTKSLVAPFNDLTPSVRVGLKSHLGPEVDLDYLTHEEKRERRDLGLDVSFDDETESI